MSQAYISEDFFHSPTNEIRRKWYEYLYHKVHEIAVLVTSIMTHHSTVTKVQKRVYASGFYFFCLGFFLTRHPLCLSRHTSVVGGCMTNTAVAGLATGNTFFRRCKESPIESKSNIVHSALGSRACPGSNTKKNILRVRSFSLPLTKSASTTSGATASTGVSVGHVSGFLHQSGSKRGATLASTSSVRVSGGGRSTTVARAESGSSAAIPPSEDDSSANKTTDKGLPSWFPMHDFCLTLPWGLFVALGGVTGFVVAGSTKSLIFGGCFGMLLVTLGGLSLKKWKVGGFWRAICLTSSYRSRLQRYKYIHRSLLMNELNCTFSPDTYTGTVRTVRTLLRFKLFCFVLVCVSLFLFERRDSAISCGLEYHKFPASWTWTQSPKHKPGDEEGDGEKAFLLRFATPVSTHHLTRLVGVGGAGVCCVFLPHPSLCVYVNAMRVGSFS